MKVTYQAWTLSDQKIQFIIETCQHYGVSNFLELGSGPSTTKLEVLFENFLSIEHLRDYAEQMNSPNIKVFPLEGGWYSIPQDTFKVKFDGLLIDGPPNYSRSLCNTREPALFRLKRWLQSPCYIFFDDFKRNLEQIYLKNWKIYYREKLQIIGNCKDLLLLKLD